MAPRVRQSVGGGRNVAHATHDDMSDFISDEEIEAVLLEEAEQTAGGPVNLPTVAGLGLLVVAFVYLLQAVNVLPGSIGGLAVAATVLSAALIVLTGMGYSLRRMSRVLKGRKAPRRARKASRGTTHERSRANQSDTGAYMDRLRGSRLRRSTDSKIFGVGGGLADYFGIDPTIVRIILVVLALATSGTAIVVYLVAAWLMAKSDKV